MMVQYDNDGPELTLWGLFVLLLVIFVAVYFLSGCVAAKTEVVAPIDAKVDAKVALVQEESQTQDIDAEGDVTVYNIGNVGWAASAAGIGWALMLFGRRKPQRAVDRIVTELGRGTSNQLETRTVIRNINNVGTRDKGYDATERYIHSRVRLAKAKKV